MLIFCITTSFKPIGSDQKHFKPVHRKQIKWLDHCWLFSIYHIFEHIQDTTLLWSRMTYLQHDDKSWIKSLNTINHSLTMHLWVTIGENICCKRIDWCKSVQNFRLHVYFIIIQCYRLIFTYSIDDVLHFDNPTIFNFYEQKTASVIDKDVFITYYKNMNSIVKNVKKTGNQEHHGCRQHQGIRKFKITYK